LFSSLLLLLVWLFFLYGVIKPVHIHSSPTRRSSDLIMGLMGVSARRVYFLTSAIGGGLAGLASCLLVLQYDVHPFIGNSFGPITDRKSTRLNSSHGSISYAVFCLKKKTHVNLSTDCV